MFVRTKKSGAYRYLQIVQNERVEGRVRQQVIATLGRLDVLQKTGQLDALLASCARFAEHSAVLSAHRQGRVAAAASNSIRRRSKRTPASTANGSCKRTPSSRPPIAP